MTAFVQDGNEESVGEAIRLEGIPREELYITTKYDGGDVEDKVQKSLDKVRSFP